MKCSVIHDLLPLYKDGVCSADSTSLVDEHLSICVECQKALRQISADMNLKLLEEGFPVSSENAIQKLSKRIRRSKVIVAILSIVIAVAMVLANYHFFFLVDSVPIPVTQIEVVALQKESNGDVFLRLRIKDGKAPVGSSWQLSYDTDTQSEYIQAMRPHVVVGTEAEVYVEIKMSSEYSPSSKKLYYGSTENYVLLWDVDTGLQTSLIVE